MVEARLARDFRIVQQIGIELDVSAAGRPAEEIHHAAAAQHLDRPVPCFAACPRLRSRYRRRGHPSVREPPPPGRASLRSQPRGPRPAATCAPVSLARRPTAITCAPRSFASLTNIEPIGPTPMTATVSPASSPVSSRPFTTQASGSASAASDNSDAARISYVLRSHDARRNANIFRISAIVEQQIFAEIHSSRGCSRSMRGRAPNLPPPRAGPAENASRFAHGDHVARELMAEERGGTIMRA